MRLVLCRIQGGHSQDCTFPVSTLACFSFVSAALRCPDVDGNPVRSNPLEEYRDGQVEGLRDQPLTSAIAVGGWQCRRYSAQALAGNRAIG